MKKNQVERQLGALERLSMQLSSGVKPKKVNGKTTGDLIPLTDQDKQRITKEIRILTEKTK